MTTRAEVENMIMRAEVENMMMRAVGENMTMPAVAENMTMPTGEEKIPFSDNLRVVFFFTFTISCWNVAESHQWKQKKGSLLNMSILLFLILTLISNWRIFEIHMKSLYVRWKKEAKICNFEIYLF